jgi:hypothetical protein
MCNQTVGLIAGAVEEAGVATVALMLLEDVARRVRPPRALSVPFRFGYPLGAPNDAPLQREIISRALRLLDRADLPVLERFEPSL